jgi:phage recombination protein Bet
MHEKEAGCVSEQALAVRDDAWLTRWAEEDKKLIWDIAANGCSESEFKLVLYLASQYGLDPLRRHLWAVKYDKTRAAQIFTGRDGLLAIAHRSGRFAGIESGIRKEGNDTIGWAKVYRSDFERPFYAEVYLEEYRQNNTMWNQKPKTMLKKVAESQALRQAFDVAALYDESEIDRAATEQAKRPTVRVESARLVPTDAPVTQTTDAQQETIVDAEVTVHEEPEPSTETPVDPVTEAEQPDPLANLPAAELRKLIWPAWKAAGKDQIALKDYLQATFNKTSTATLTADEMRQTIKYPAPTPQETLVN